LNSCFDDGMAKGDVTNRSRSLAAFKWFRGIFVS
jgi:hypothetical protein